MVEDEWDWDHDCEPVDLDGCDMTGNPAEDIAGFESPSRRGQNLTGFVSSGGDWFSRADEMRAERQAKREAWRQRLDAQKREREAARRAAPEQRPARAHVVSHGPATTPAPAQPDLAPHVVQAIAEGMLGRDLGWWKVDVDSTGRAVWTRVDAPGDTGPRMTVEQTRAPAPTPAPQWAPVEMTEPSPGVRVW